MDQKTVSTGRREGADSLWTRASRLHDKVAVIGSDGASVTFGELVDHINRLTNAIAELGLEGGSVLAGLLANTSRVFTVFGAALQSGLYFLPVNTHLGPAEVAYILRDAGARLLIADDRFGEVARSSCDEAGLKRERRIARGMIAGFVSLDRLMEKASPERPVTHPAGHRLLYTSGTTGRPKGVLKPLPPFDADEYGPRNALRLAANAHFPEGEDNVHLVTGPTYHGAPLGYGMGALQLGQTVVLMDRWDAEETLRLIERYRVTTMHVVPTMFHRLLQLEPEVRRAYDLSSLRAVAHAAAPCPVALKKAVIEWLGPIVHEYYSSSEGGGTSVSAEEWQKRPGTVGRPVPGAEVRILDDGGQPAGTGTPGLVYFRLREPFEYLHDPDKTAAARVGDFFTVGDIGYLDGEGYLYLCDRQAETIISGGVNIYPAEIEAVLITHPSVADAAVIGVPNDEWGEEVKAVVELAASIDDPDAAVTALLDHCRVSLPKFKWPRTIDVVAELPRDANGKLYRRLLRDRYWQGRDRRI
jgi:long-chain acyl-CoA synthetase